MRSSKDKGNGLLLFALIGILNLLSYSARRYSETKLGFSTAMPLAQFARYDNISVFLGGSIVQEDVENCEMVFLSLSLDVYKKKKVHENNNN